MLPERFENGGFLLYPKGELTPNEYTFNLILGEDGRNTVSSPPVVNRTSITTFGKYPSIYYAGTTHFKIFSLQHTFSSVYDEKTGNVTLSAYERYLSFEEEIKQRKTWIVEGSMVGDCHICDITITGVDYEQNAMAYHNGDIPLEEDDCLNTWYDWVTVTIECTEISSYIPVKRKIPPTKEI